MPNFLGKLGKTWAFPALPLVLLSVTAATLVTGYVGSKSVNYLIDEQVKKRTQNLSDGNATLRALGDEHDNEKSEFQEKVRALENEVRGKQDLLNEKGEEVDSYKNNLDIAREELGEVRSEIESMMPPSLPPAVPQSPIPSPPPTSPTPVEPIPPPEDNQVHSQESQSESPQAQTPRPEGFQGTIE